MASNEIEVLTETSDTANSTAGSEATPAGRDVNRRRFLAALGITGAVAGAGMISGCTTSSTTTSATPTSRTQAQVDALNFALNLKYLSATFYSFITKGADLPSSQTIGSGTPTGTPSQLTIAGATPSQTTDLLNEITYDEVNHVTALRNALGSSAVARPALNLGSFGTITASNAISIARALEDLNVTALAAVATLLQSGNISITAQILAADSFHAGALRLVSLENPSIAAFIKMDSIDVPVFDPGTAALAAAGPTASGAFFATAGASTASAADPAGMAFNRTASQTLAILYGSAPGSLASSGAKSGGFFPNGMNGSIVSV